MRFMKTIELPTLASMGVLAHSVAQELCGQHVSDRATIIALSGDLGAGKTTFTQYLARELGITETVQSPTFVLSRGYAIDGIWPKRLLHIDAYRLEGFSALHALDWVREVKQGDTLIVLEWPECVAPLTPTPDILMTFTVSEGGGRTVRIDGMMEE